MFEGNSSSLADMECAPCKGDTPPLKGKSLQEYYSKLGDAWNLIDEQRLERTYKFKNFRQALDFTVHVGELAESVNHHPDIYLAWGLARITLWTHKIGGLSEADFVLAAKVDRLYQE